MVSCYYYDVLFVGLVALFLVFFYAVVLWCCGAVVLV